ncbi:MAG: FlxA-like family protein [Clostridiaceae bacterium]
MNISSVGGRSSSDFAIKSNGIDNEIKSLEKEKMKIQEQIQRINGEKIDDKTKSEMIKPLKEQIENINTLIQQKQMEKIQGNKRENKSPENNSSKNNSIDSDTYTPGMDNLIKVSTSYNEMKSINEIKTKLDGNSRILKKEAELDRDRGNIKIAEGKEKKASEFENRSNNISSKIGEMAEEINAEVTKNVEGNNKDKDNPSLVEDNKSNETQVKDEYVTPKKIDTLA